MVEVSEPVVSLPVPNRAFLTEVLRQGAQRMLASAIEAEIDEWMAARSHLKDAGGRQQVVRNGHLPERTIVTGLGDVEVRQPRVRDRRPEGEREHFSSTLLPPYLRRTKSVDELMPWLYLKGIRTCDMPEALLALLGPDCGNLSANTVVRLKQAWEAEHEEWSKRSLEGRTYTSRPFGQVFRAILEVQDHLRPMFEAAGAEPFRAGPQAYTSRKTVDRIMKLHNEGMSVREIASKVGKSSTTVHRHIQLTLEREASAAE